MNRKQLIDEKVTVLVKELKAAGISVKYDDNDNNRPGWKFAEYEMKGVPVRIAIGARDLANNVVEVARRDTKEKMSYSIDGLAQILLHCWMIYRLPFSIRQKRSEMNILPKPITGMNL